MLPAGGYRVATDEELIEGLSFPAYRRASTMIFVPAQSASSVEMVAIDPQELRAAQERDQSDGGEALGPPVADAILGRTEAADAGERRSAIIHASLPKST